MFQLILKDILLLKKTLLFAAIYIIVMIIFLKQDSAVVFLVSIIAVNYILILSACAHDDKNKADILLNSFPLTRRTIVMARYCSIFVFTIIAIAYYLVIAYILQMIGPSIQVHSVSLESIIVALCAVIFINSIYFPVLFKVGFIHSRLVSFALFFGTFALVPKFFEQANHPFIQNVVHYLERLSDVEVMAIVIVAMISLLTISFFLSLQFYRKREF
ncbi:MULTISPECIES: ABC-2 transporter permease [Parageobacillus]|jgi:ABC-2 type transport system permease protein|uniref:Multidrug transporter n=1 Tax=Parageobacillus galactosidasius TaxID=883812 RepID=A0A226QR13_9BACL|nr:MULTISPECIES: ABC-2 transporter permease [Parageobacillus]OXB93819.1 multidrug transporter [Parageobacillus galactosidasius]WMT20414.1 ABC-2 transporter permease [Parageobacillus toebii]